MEHAGQYPLFLQKHGPCDIVHSSCKSDSSCMGTLWGCLEHQCILLCLVMFLL